MSHRVGNHLQECFLTVLSDLIEFEIIESQFSPLTTNSRGIIRFFLHSHDCPGFGVVLVWFSFLPNDSVPLNSNFSDFS